MLGNIEIQVERYHEKIKLVLQNNSADKISFIIETFRCINSCHYFICDLVDFCISETILLYLYGSVGDSFPLQATNLTNFHIY